MGTTMRWLVVATAVWALQACTQQSVYEAIQNREKVLCEQQPPAEYRDCIARASKPYSTYKREKDEAERKK